MKEFDFLGDRKRRRFLTTPVAVGSSGYVIVIMVVWAMVRTVSERWWPITLVLYGPTWALGLPLAVFVPAAVIGRKRVRLLALVLAGVVVAWPIGGLCLCPKNLSSTPASHDVRVLTCNVEGAHGDVYALSSLIADASPDVVLFQEWPAGRVPRLFVPVFSGPAWFESVRGTMCIVSRYPIQNERSADAELGGPGSLQCCELATAYGPIQLTNVHLATPHDGLDLFVRLRWKKWKAVPELEQNMELRRHESEVASSFVKRARGPLLVGGDFNLPCESHIFRESWSSFDDAFSVAGNGWGYTKHTRLIGCRIDHILSGSHWKCTRCWVGPDVGSDHRPLLADFQFLHE